MNFKSLLQLVFLALTTASAGQAATATNWWDSKTSQTNITEELPAFPGSVCLGNGVTSGTVQDTIILPSEAYWKVDFVVRAPGEASDPTDEVEIRLDGSLVATIDNNVGLSVEQPVSYSFFGTSFTYQFDFTSSESQIEKHQFILEGTAEEQGPVVSSVSPLQGDVDALVGTNAMRYSM